MAVTQQTPINTYAANGVTQVFPYNFLLLSDGDLVVKVTDASGVTTTKTLGADYTVTFVGVSTGGNVTFTVAPAAGSAVVLYRDTQIARATDYQNNGDFLADTVNDDFDRLWLALQELSSGGKAPASTIRAPSGEALTELPAASARAGYFLGFDGAGQPVPLSATSGTAAALSADLASSAVAKGASLLTAILRKAGAVARTQESKNSERISIFDFMTAAQIADWQAGTLLFDHNVAINTALSVAYVLTFTDPFFTHKGGGWEVYLPPGVGRSDAGPITVPGGIGLHGAGGFSTIIKSSFNGHIIRGQPATGCYNMTGSHWSGFTVIGDRTKTSQVGIALLRPTDSTFDSITVHSCGGDSWLIREGLSCVFINPMAIRGVGAGFRLMDGVNSWTDSTPTNFPTNNLTFVNIHSLAVDGPGLKMDGTGSGTLGYVNGCEFLGGTLEFSYYSSAAGVGYNLEDFSINYFPNILSGVWFESTTIKSHILQTGATIADTLILRGCKHTSNGAAGYPERFAIVTVGTLVADGCQGIGQTYRSVGGSTAPIRVTKATARVEVNNLRGSSVTGGIWVEDSANATTGLYNNVRQTVFGASYGPMSHRTDSTDVGFEQYRTGDSQPFFRLAGDRTLRMGTGSAAPVSVLTNNLIGVSADRGDASVTVVAGVDEVTQRFATALTANRTVTLSTTGVVKGHRFRVVRTGLGAFTIDVGGLKTIPSGTAAWVEVEHDGTAWRLTGYGTL